MMYVLGAKSAREILRKIDQCSPLIISLIDLIGLKNHSNSINATAQLSH